MVYDPWQMFIWLTTSIKSENFRFIDSSAPLLKLKLHSHVIGSFYCISFFIWIAKNIGTNAIMKMHLCYFKDTIFYHIIGDEKFVSLLKIYTPVQLCSIVIENCQLQSFCVILLAVFWGQRSNVSTVFPHIVSAETILFLIWKSKGRST